MKVKVAQSCPTLCNPVDGTVHGILQARIWECIDFPFSRGSSQPRGQTQMSNPDLPHFKWILYQGSHKGSPRMVVGWGNFTEEGREGFPEEVALELLFDVRGTEEGGL